MARERRSNHWASKCKLNFSQEFSQKNIPFERPTDDLKRGELKALGTFFGIEEHDDQDSDKEEQVASPKNKDSFEKTSNFKSFAMRWRKNAKASAKVVESLPSADADVSPTSAAEDETYAAPAGSKDDETEGRQKSNDSVRVRQKPQRVREPNLVGKGDLLNQAATSALEQRRRATSSTLPPMNGSDGTSSRETATVRISSPYSSESSQRQEGGKHDERDGRTKDSARARPKIQFVLKDEKDVLELPEAEPPTTYASEALPSIYGSESSRQESQRLRSRDPPTEVELGDAKPPEPIGMDNFPPLYQRMPEKKQETHYDYFGRHLPTESPRHRQAMRLRTEVLRKSYHKTSTGDVEGNEGKIASIRTAQPARAIGGGRVRRLSQPDLQDKFFSTPDGGLK